MHLYDLHSPGDPRQCPWILLQWNTISRSLLRWNAIWLISNRINWFPWISFQSKRYRRNFCHCSRFPRTSSTDSFNFFHEFPINGFCSQGLQNNKKAFLFFTVFKKSIHWVLVGGVNFHSLLMNEMAFNGFSNNEVQFRRFPTNEINFQIISAMQSFPKCFQSTILVFVGFPLTIRWLHGLSFA